MAKKRRDVPRGATPLPKRKESRQWNIALPKIHWQWLFVPLLLVMLVGGARWMYHSWPVTNIEVTGRMSFWQEDDIRQRLSWVTEESFFSLDVNTVYQQVQALPLVVKATVRKRWPGTLEVQLTEDIPVALWNSDQLLSASGGLSAVPDGMNVSHLTSMQGPAQQAEQAVRYFRRVQQMLNTQSVMVKHLSISATGSIRVLLSNGWQVEFGRQYFEERVLRLEKLLQYLPQEKVAGIDLRYGKGAAIRWRHEQEIG